MSRTLKGNLILSLVLFVLTSLYGQSVVAQDPDSVATADSLLLELQRDLAAMTPSQPRQNSRRPRPTTNPDISVIGDTRALYFSDGERNFDFDFHEVETAFKSVIDP